MATSKKVATKKNLYGFNLGLGIYCSLVLWLFIKRVPFPDVSFDTMNYHYFAGYLAFGEIMGVDPSANFLPLGIHTFNPGFSLLNYILSITLGYRLGTVVSLLAIIATGFLVMKIAFRFIEPNFMNSLLLIPFLIVNEGLFQIATYFTDILFALVGLSATLVLLHLWGSNSRSTTWLLMALLGILLGVQFWKPTNATVIIPQLVVALVYVRKRWLSGDLFTAKAFVVATVPLASLSGFTYPFFMFLESGNPVFPYFNSLFKSPYYPETSWGFNYGPNNFFEAVFYPVFSSLEPTLLGEVKDLFPDIKLNILFFLGVLVLLAFRFLKIKIRDELKILAGLAFSSYAIWAYMFGYSRYAIGIELLFGVLVVSLLLNSELNSIKHSKAFFSKFLGFFAFGLVSTLSLAIIFFNWNYDISFRPTVSPSDLTQEILSPYFFNYRTSVDQAISEQLSGVDIIVQCANPTSGFLPGLSELAGKPFINLDDGSNGAMSKDPDYKREIESRLIRAFGKTKLKFVAVYSATDLYAGPSNEFSSVCSSALRAQRAAGRFIEIEETKVVPSFMGSPYTDFFVAFGLYELNPVP